MASLDEPDYKFPMTPELSKSLERLQQMLEPKINIAMTPELSKSLERIERMLEPKIEFAMAPGLSESLERLSQMMSPTVNVALTPEVTGTSLTLTKAIAPLLDSYQAAFQSVGPSIDLLVRRMNDVSAATSPSVDALTRIQRQIAEEMAPSLPAIRSFSAQFHEALSEDEVSALAEAMRTAGDLEQDEIKQVIADLGDGEVGAIHMPDDELLAEWVDIRKGLTGIFALAVGAKWFGLHVEEPELAAMVDAALASAGVTWSLFQFLNKPGHED